LQTVAEVGAVVERISLDGESLSFDEFEVFLRPYMSNKLTV